MSWTQEAGFEPAISRLDRSFLYQLSYSWAVNYMKPIAAIGRKCFFETSLRARRLSTGLALLPRLREA